MNRMFEYLDVMFSCGVDTVRGLARGLATEFEISLENSTKVVAAWIIARKHFLL